MPQIRTREASKRQIMGDLSTNGVNICSGSSRTQTSSANSVDQSWAKSMRDEMEKRIAALRDDCENEKSKQQQVFISAMMKLPKNIKNMTISEFHALYKMNLLQSSLISPEIFSESLSEAMQKDSDLQTPAPAPKYPMEFKSNMTTPFRTVRKGEPLFSKNGSPVEAGAQGGGDGAPRLVATVIKPPPQASVGPRLLSTAVAASLEIDVGNGQLISLNDPYTGAIKRLPPEQVDSTILQLEILKKQVDSAMQHLKKN